MVVENCQYLVYESKSCAMAQVVETGLSLAECPFTAAYGPARIWRLKWLKIMKLESPEERQTALVALFQAGSSKESFCVFLLMNANDIQYFPMMTE